MANRRRNQNRPVNYGAIFGALLLGVGIVTILFGFGIFDIAIITGKDT